MASGSNTRELVGFYFTGMGDMVELPDVKVFGRHETLPQLAGRLRVQEIIVASKEQRGGSMPMEELLTCRTNGVKILDSAAFYERIHAEIPLDSLKASWLVYGAGFVQGPGRRVAKRVFDVVSSSVLLLLGLPVMALAALAIKLDSAGPIIYRQERVGENGRRFWCLKLRSMRIDAEKGRGGSLGEQERFAHYPSRCVHAQDAHRRTAPALQRAQGRNEHGRPASRAGLRSSNSCATRFLSMTSGTA